MKRKENFKIRVCNMACTKHVPTLRCNIKFYVAKTKKNIIMIIVYYDIQKTK